MLYVSILHCTIKYWSSLHMAQLFFCKMQIYNIQDYIIIYFLENYYFYQFSFATIIIFSLLFTRCYSSMKVFGKKKNTHILVPLLSKTGFDYFLILITVLSIKLPLLFFPVSKWGHILGQTFLLPCFKPECEP